MIQYAVHEDVESVAAMVRVMLGETGMSTLARPTDALDDYLHYMVEEQHLLVAVKEAQVVGATSWHVVHPYWSNTRLAARGEFVVVIPRLRGHGYGKRLLKAREEAARNEGATFMIVDATMDSEIGSMHSRNGYEVMQTVYIKGLA